MIVVHKNNQGHRGQKPMISNSFMNKLRSVLFNTLKSLNQGNSRLARYFVQHHPSLNKVYKKMTGHSAKPLLVTTNRRANLRHKETINTKKINNQKVVTHTHKAMTNTTNSLTSAKIKHPEVENNVTHVSNIHTESKPILVELSEFVKSTPMQNKDHSMNVGNITTRSLTANKLSSSVITANNIIANNVIVNRKRKQNKNTFQYQKQTKPKNVRRIQPVSFSFRNNGGRGSGFGLIRQKPIIYTRSLFDNTKFDRRNFFPPRQNAGHSNNYFGSRTRLISQPRQMQPVQRNFNMQLQNMNSQPNFQRQQTMRKNVATVSIANRNPDPHFRFSMPKQTFTQQQKRRIPTQIRIQPTNHHRKPWFDSWSEFDDSDDEYYDDEYEESSDETAIQSILRGKDINAESIYAQSMFADSVKADTIDVPRVIAKNVVVSARYG